MKMIKAVFINSNSYFRHIISQ